MLVIGVGGTHAEDRGQAAFNLLVGVEPRRRAIAWGTDVERNRISVLRLAFIAAGYGSRHTSTKAGGEDIAVVVAGAGSNITERETKNVGTMFQGKFNTLDKMCRFAITLCTQNLDSHDFGTWSDTCLRASIALTRDDSGGMRAMTLVVHGVVVLVENVIAVVRELAASVPHAVGDVDMVVVDASVDESDDDAVACIASAVIVPH